MDTLPHPKEESSLKEQFSSLLRQRRRQIDELLAEHQACLEELEVALERLQIPGASQKVTPEVDFRRRYELALDELRALKAENTALRKQLTEHQTPRTVDNSASVNLHSSWEAEKRRILAMLENANEEASQQTGNSQISGTGVNSTETTPCKMERFSYGQAGNSQTVDTPNAQQPPVSAPGGEDFLRAERERFLQLQQEWQEKLRQAEIELSMERAKLARQRAELEERLRTLQTGAEPPPASETAGFYSPRRRQWLARLGLLEGEQKEDRTR